MARMKVTFDSSTERSGVRSDKIPEGEYGLQVISAKLGTSPTKQTKQAVVSVKIIEDPEHGGKYVGKKLIINFNLLKQSLWVLRGFLEAIGVKVRSGTTLTLDTEAWKGKKFGGTVEDDEYTSSGKTKVVSRVRDYYPIAELEDRAAATKAEDADLDDDEDDEEEDEVDEEEDDEEEEEDEEDDEDEEEDEEEEEPAPRRRRAAPKAKAKPAAKKTTRRKKPADDEDEDELEGIDLDEM